MKDAFKVKKGLNVQPTDPADVVNPEAGDLIVDSTDDNRLKVYDPTSSEFAAVGTGGSSGNILSDIEKLTPTVSNVVAVTDTTTFLPIDDNNKSVKATFSGSDGSIRYEGPASADLDGVQGVVKVWIKTDVEGLSLVATKDGVAQNNGVTVNSSNKWRQYEIPVVLGDADYGFEIQASGAVSGDVYIDEAFVKVEAVIRDLGAAHFVGSASWSGSTGCNWLTASSTYADLPTNPSCANAIVTGSIVLDDLKRPIIKIPNARTDGHYEFSFRGVMGANTASIATAVYQRIVADGVQIQNDDRQSDTSNFFQDAVGTIRFTSGGSKTISIQFATLNASNQAGIFATTVNRRFWISAKFYPDDKSTIVTQDTELTAKTANEFSLTTIGGNVVSENYDWVVGNPTSSSNVYTYTIKPNIFTVNPSCTCTAGPFGGSTADYTCSVNTINTTTLAVNMTVNGGGVLTSHSIHCSKQGADVNKSATIVGKFENINSSDLVVVEAFGNTGIGITSLTTDVQWSSEKEDDYNAWNGTQFTSPRDSCYDINAGVRSTANTQSQLRLYINGSPNGVYKAPMASYIIKNYEFANVCLNKDDVLSFRSDSGYTLQPDTSYHRLVIQERPNTQSIIKNLSNQKVECQTKYLSANVTTAGVMSDLTFNNLEVGKNYKLYSSFRIADSSTSSNEKYGVILINNGAITLNSLFMRGLNINRMQSSPSSTEFFKATDDTVTFNASLLTNVQVAGAASYSKVTLCELPDTYVETTKF